MHVLNSTHMLQVHYICNTQTYIYTVHTTMEIYKVSSHGCEHHRLFISHVYQVFMKENASSPHFSNAAAVTKLGSSRGVSSLLVSFRAADTTFPQPRHTTLFTTCCCWCWCCVFSSSFCAPTQEDDAATTRKSATPTAAIGTDKSF